MVTILMEMKFEALRAYPKGKTERLKHFYFTGKALQQMRYFRPFCLVDWVVCFGKS
jgi:hypothetical protein